MEKYVAELPLNIAQISSSYPNTNELNPLEIYLGRNKNFTVFNRMYIQTDLSLLPSNIIINRAYIKMVILDTIDHTATNNANLMGFLVLSTVSNINFVTWNNLPYFDIFSSFYNKDVYRNSIIYVDVTTYILGFYTGVIPNNGFLFINNESSYNMIVFDGNAVTGNKPVLLVEYSLSPGSNFYEETLSINQSGGIYYSPDIPINQLQWITVFIKNLRAIPIDVTLEISGNGIDYVEDNYSTNIIQNETQSITPYYWAKFMRIKLTTTDTSIEGSIIVQGILQQ